jgi:hypothetical protein
MPVPKRHTVQDFFKRFNIHFPSVTIISLFGNRSPLLILWDSRAEAITIEFLVDGLLKHGVVGMVTASATGGSKGEGWSKEIAAICGLRLQDTTFYPGLPLVG